MPSERIHKFHCTDYNRCIQRMWLQEQFHVNVMISFTGFIWIYSTNFTATFIHNTIIYNIFYYIQYLLLYTISSIIYNIFYYIQYLLLYTISFQQPTETSSFACSFTVPFCFPRQCQYRTCLKQMPVPNTLKTDGGGIIRSGAVFSCPIGNDCRLQTWLLRIIIAHYRSTMLAHILWRAKGLEDKAWSSNTGVATKCHTVQPYWLQHIYTCRIYHCGGHSRKWLQRG